MRTASSTSSYGITDSTGPKISSWAIRIRLSTSAKTVGRTYQPGRGPSGGRAADDDAGALVLAERDVLLDPLLLALGDQRADLGGGVGGVADRHRAHRLGQRVDDPVVAAAAGEDAGLGDARLAVVHERGEPQARHRGVEVGVVEHDRGRLAAQLEADPLQLLAADRGDLAAGRGGAGEGDLVDAGVRHQVLAGLAAAGHDVDHAVRARRPPPAARPAGSRRAASRAPASRPPCSRRAAPAPAST